MEATLLGGERTSHRALSGSDGKAIIRLPSSGIYRLVVLRVGFRPVLLGEFDLGDGSTTLPPFALRDVRLSLDTVRIIAANRCARAGTLDASIAAALEQARSLIAAALVTSRDLEARTYWSSYRLYADAAGAPLSPLVVERHESDSREAFRVSEPERLLSDGLVRASKSTVTYSALDAAALVSEAFLDRHCFAGERSAANAGWIGVRFTPQTERMQRRSDVSGVMWLDAETAELKRLDLQYPSEDPDISVPATGSVEFERRPSGTTFVTRWHLRLPRPTVYHEPANRGRPPTRHTVVNAVAIVAAGIDSIVAESGTLVRYTATAAMLTDRLGLEPGRVPRCEASPGSAVSDSASVYGVIVDRDGRPRMDSRVRVSWTALGSSRFARNARESRDAPAMDGFFLVCGLPRTAVRVEVLSRGQEFAPVTVRLDRSGGRSPIEFRMRVP